VLSLHYRNIKNKQLASDFKGLTLFFFYGEQHGQNKGNIY
jgi:hypothetical protein